MAQTPSNVFCLERINSIIDLCIDNDLYGDLGSFLTLTTVKGKKLKLQQFLCKGKLPRFCISKLQLDTRGLRDLLNPYHNVVLGDINSISSSDNTYKLWLALFWTKALRAELKKNGTGDQDDQYDQLIGFLEKKMPMVDRSSDIDKIRIAINFLMELSALAPGEASYGYAIRAKSLLKPIFKDHEKQERDPYDRWIAYNKGIANHHMGDRNLRAVLEFNWIIEGFAKHVGKISDFRSKEHGLEFLLNICPGTLQRAALNLKMQLSYHALQTLVEKHMDWLRELANSDCRLFKNAAEKLMLRADLYRLEALLQLEAPKSDTKKKLGELYPRVFNGTEWTSIEGTLPKVDENKGNLQTQLVEHTVTWYLRRMRENSSAIRSAQNKKPQDKEQCNTIVADVIAFDEPGILEAIEGKYWEWIKKSNWFDKRIYFSRWAQFLQAAAERVEQFQKLSEDKVTGVKTEHIQKLLVAGISLYWARRTCLPVKRKLQGKGEISKDTIQLENLRSDELPDIVKGLSSFYKSMNKIAQPGSNVPNLRDLFIKRTGGLDLVATLRDDHLGLLDAIDGLEESFTDRQRISRLNRCKERLIWFDDQNHAGCQKCLFPLDTQANPLAWAFKGLMPCAKDSSPTGGGDCILRQHLNEDFAHQHLDDSDYEYIMQQTERDLVQHLKTESQHEPRKKALHFVGLQRWNSETPAQGRSVGGGYFIYRTDEKGRVDLGIAVDPGFDFIRNFFRMGFSLKDIDIVLVSHAHPDHLWDFESIIHLLHELEDKKKIFHRVHAILTLSSYTRLEHVITNPKLKRYVNPLIIDIRKEIDDQYFENLGKCNTGNAVNFKNTFRFKFKKASDGEQANNDDWKLFLPLNSESDDSDPSDDTLDIMPTRAYHDDHSMRSDSFGFLLNFFASNSSLKGRKPFLLGYTGDSKWVSDDLYCSKCPVNSDCSRNLVDNKCKWQSTADQYKECDVLLTHLGSLIDHKNDRGFKAYSPKECENLIRDKNHPYLMGMIRFLRSLYDISSKSKLILIGEFGEELRGGIRTDLMDRLRNGVTPDWPVMPVDVGLDICLHDLSPANDEIVDQTFKFQCVLCERYISVKKIEYLRFGHDEGIFYSCSTCYKATPEDVRNAKLQRLYEVGRELRT